MKELVMQSLKILQGSFDKMQIAEFPSGGLGIIIGVFVFQLLFADKKRLNLKKIKTIITSLIGLVALFFLNKNWYISGIFIGFLGHLIDYKYNVWKLAKGKINSWQFNTSTQCSRAFEEIEEEELKKTKKNKF